jgi:hypothetical protein
MPLGKRGGDATPAEMSLRETVEQKDGRPAASAGYEIVGPADLQTPVLHVRNRPTDHDYIIIGVNGTP